MPQLSLYIDEETLSKLEAGAKLNNLSVSKYVTDALRKYFSNNWSDDFKTLFGSIHDDSFNVESIRDYSCDVERETL